MGAGCARLWSLVRRDGAAEGWSHEQTDGGRSGVGGTVGGTGGGAAQVAVARQHGDGICDLGERAQVVEVEQQAACRHWRQPDRVEALSDH